MVRGGLVAGVQAVGDPGRGSSLSRAHGRAPTFAGLPGGRGSKWLILPPVRTGSVAMRMSGATAARPQLVGRVAELRRLTAQLDAAADGAGRVVLLSGDSGIGKSRLAAEVLEVSERRGFVALRGRAHLLHAGLAYAPFVEALSPHIAGENVHANAAWLAGLPGAAELGQLFPGLPVGPPPQPLGDPALERMRLFEAVAGLLGRMARRRPLVLWLDDLHLADRATIELAHYLCSAVGDRRLLVLLTWRGGDSEGPLGQLVTSLRRRDECIEVQLGPIEGSAVAELIIELLGGEPPHGLLDAVSTRAGGVPLFVTALVQQLISSGHLRRGPAGWAIVGDALSMLPAIVRDVVVSRLARLDADERSLFELVAVAGGAGTPDVLQAIRGTELHRSLRRLLAERLLTERPVGRGVVYEVAHPLYAEVAYGELTVLERRRTHARLAAAVDGLRPGDVVALAPHYQGAGDLVDPERALQVLAAAGHRALTLHADAEAARFLGDAVDLAHELGRAALVPELLEALGNALERCGDIGGAVAAWGAALAGDGSIPVDSLTFARLHSRLALLEWERGNLDVAEAHLQHGLAAHPPVDGVIEEHHLRLIVIARSGDVQILTAAVSRMEELARRYPSAVASAFTHISRSSLALCRCDYFAARAEGEQALALLDPSDSMFVVGGPHRQIGLAALAAGDLAAARAHSSLAVRAAHEHGVPSVECSLRINLAIAGFLAGDWVTAEAELDEAVGLGRRTMSTRSLAAALVWQAFLHLHRGALGQARACLTESERIFPSGADRHVSGDFAVVRATLDRLTGAEPAGLPADIPLTGARYPLAFPLLGEARLAGGDRAGTQAVIEQLRGCPGSPPLPGAFADRLAGLLTGDDTVLASAQRAFEELGLPFEAARVALERSELVVDVPGVTAALAVFDRLGAKSWGDRARRLLRRQGIRAAPVGRAGDVLSAREAEVARLVADGLSNAEIAERLYLSVRTVETHLRKVYARLGLGSRVALARWVAAHPPA